MWTLLFGLLGAQTAAAAAVANVQERGRCNADNCLRNLRDHRYVSSASAFCSKWLQSTVTDTFYDVATTYTTVTSTPEVVTVTNDVSITITTTTGTNTIYSTVIGDPRYVKRGRIGHPKWLDGGYPASRVSSACSCLIASPSPAVHLSITLTTSTATVVNTLTLPTSTTLTTLTVTQTQPVAATTSVPETVYCGLHSCSTIPSRGPFQQIYPFRGTFEACRDICRGNSMCLSFEYAWFGGNVGSCQLMIQSANDAYWPEVAQRCQSFRIYDRGCDAPL
ncbi:hypothetical protein TWF481_001983 [Arthrobotrys musiformis]|uniref:Apple domain-containing protein n=1 Tax=Arthrobotrys musiformis TaxID=47236 RepID=A0AAV9VUX1_9PEZI